MHHQTDFCVLGAGLAGLSVGDALQEHGFETIVVEKNAIGSGASGTPGGLVNPAIGRRGTKVWKAEEGYRAIAENLEKIQQHGDEPFYQKNGLLRPALLEKMAQKMKEQYELTLWPDGWCQWKSELEIKELHPGIQCVDGGLWLPIGLTVDVGSYLQAYAEYLIGTGLSFKTGTHPYLTENNGGWKIELDTDTIQADNIVFSTGAQTKSSFWWDWLPLELTKGQTATYSTNGETLSFSHSISSLGYIAQSHRDNTFIQGSTYEHDFNHLEPDKKGQQYLRKRMRRTLPKLAEEATLVDQWAGIRVFTPDKKPILGRHPIHNNMHIFTALGSKGLLYSKFLANHYIDHLINRTGLFPKIAIERYTKTRR